MVTNEAAARMALEKPHSCATAFASGSTDGLPPDLSALRPYGTRCLEAELAQGRSPGYRIDYLAGVPDARGRRQVYAACAQPTLARLQTLVVDDDGAVQALWADEPSRPPADLPLPCTPAWTGHPVALAKTIKHCAVAFAARHPVVGYPVSLGQLAKDNEGCPHDEGHEHDWALKVWRAAYLSAAPGADAKEIALEAESLDEPVCGTDLVPRDVKPDLEEIVLCRRGEICQAQRSLRRFRPWVLMLATIAASKGLRCPRSS